MPRLSKRSKYLRKKNTANKSTKSEAVTPSKEVILIRLNKYIAQSGLCSRREADVLIKAGKIQVNGKVVKELGIKVKRSDKVKFRNKTLSPEKLIYVLLNKPKDFITTTGDPENRKTVMNLIARASEERIYPVGRLDRNTTGLLLFTKSCGGCRK